MGMLQESDIGIGISGVEGMQVQKLRVCGSFVGILDKMINFPLYLESFSCESPGCYVE